MRFLLLLCLVACSGVGRGPGEASSKSVEGAVDGDMPPALSVPVVEFGLPTLHDDELEEGCANGLAGDDLLVVVNKEHGQNLRCDWRPRDLVRIPRRYLVPARLRRDRIPRLREPAAAALFQMMEAARDDGIRFYVRSAYRSYAEQAQLFHHKVNEHGESHAERFSAQAGRSQHQLGTTVDLTSEALHYRIEDDFADTRSGAWLSENAYRFGFALSYPEGHEEDTGYAFEPWHFRYIGRQAASELARSGIILDEYLLACQDDRSELSCSAE